MRRALLLLAFSLVLAGGRPGASAAGERSAALVRQTARLLMTGEADRAVAIARATLHPDTADAPLRAELIKGYAVRDRVCLPVPPTPAAFAPAPAGHSACDASFLPRATRDSIAAVIAAEMRLAPDDLASYLLTVDHELNFGTPLGLSAALAPLGRFDPAAVDERLLERLSMTRRPAQLGVLARALLARNPRRADCMANERVLSGLAQGADFDGVRALWEALAADSLCARRLGSVAASALTAGARYGELWELTRVAPPGTSAVEYYGTVLLSTLAAAHFDTERALMRLDYERVNEESYPEPARAILADLRRLLAAPAAAGGDWAVLAMDPFLAGENYRDARHLIYSLALRRDPHLAPAARAMAEDLAGQNIPAAAARVCNEFAGGLVPALDRRWDPRRPEYLRKAAAYYFMAEDDAACLAALAALEAPEPADDLLAGAAALRAGDPWVARLTRARERAPEPAMQETAARLLALAEEAAAEEAP